MYEGLPSELMKQIGMIDIDRPLDVPGAIKKIRRPLDRLLGLVGRSSDTGARARSKASPKKGALKQVRPFSDEQAARIIGNIQRAYAADLQVYPPGLLSREQRKNKFGKPLFEDFLTIAGFGMIFDPLARNLLHSL